MNKCEYCNKKDYKNDFDYDIYYINKDTHMKYYFCCRGHYHKFNEITDLETVDNKMIECNNCKEYFNYSNRIQVDVIKNGKTYNGKYCSESCEKEQIDSLGDFVWDSKVSAYIEREKPKVVYDNFDVKKALDESNQDDFKKDKNKEFYARQRAIYLEKEKKKIQLRIEKKAKEELDKNKPKENKNKDLVNILLIFFGVMFGAIIITQSILLAIVFWLVYYFYKETIKLEISKLIKDLKI